MKKLVGVLVGVAFVLASIQPLVAGEKVGGECRADVQKYCKTVKPGEGRVAKCLKRNKVSQPCSAKLKAKEIKAAKKVEKQKLAAKKKAERAKLKAEKDKVKAAKKAENEKLAAKKKAEKAKLEAAKEKAKASKQAQKEKALKKRG